MTTVSEFPFAAVVGQSALKTALLLNAIDPRVGGVLISGPRGSAKSTLARALAAILPDDAEGRRPPFVTLPLGASEERLTGSLDLQRVLAEREAAFQPGLLARADGGVLYVDEVNLLPDPLVDLLLDAAASGTNSVERDGISHTHPARFALVGTMNPDEGELRPQLLDRFGLCLEQQATVSIEERIAILRQCEAFDRDPEGVMASHAEAQAALTQSIRRAQQRLAEIVSEAWVYEHIARGCEAAGVEGLRADVTWHRAARAHAAWRGVVAAGEHTVGEHAVSEQDLAAVEPWVLAHRRTQDSAIPPSHPPTQPSSSGQSPSQSPPSGGGSAGAGTGVAGRDGQASGGSGDHADQAPEAQGQWGAMPPQAQQSISVAAISLRECAAPAPENASESPPGKTRLNTPAVSPASAKRRGSQPGQRRAPGNAPRPDWFATLIANRGHWPWRELRYRQARSGQPMLHLVLLDTSASTLGGQLLGRAKGLVQQLGREAYAAREQLAVLGFGNDAITPLLPRRRAPKMLPVRFEALGGGGGTPLRAAILRAARLIDQWRRQEAGLKVRTYLITDGRTRQSLAGLPPLGECVVVDTEQGAVKRGRGAQIARQLGARYLCLAKFSLPDSSGQALRARP